MRILLATRRHLQNVNFARSIRPLVCGLWRIGVNGCNSPCFHGANKLVISASLSGWLTRKMLCLSLYSATGRPCSRQ
jgi:hypothetical protein